MPKRTNDFQELVHMIQMALAPNGANVTESYLTEDLREIDVLIESELGPYSIKIAVEAKDEKRPLDQLVVEGLIGKYSGEGCIHVNHVVLIARNGFTAGARDRASKAKMELLTLEQANQSDWTRLAPQNMMWKMPPHIASVELIPPVKSRKGKDPLSEGQFVCKCHGSNKGTPLQWANWIFLNQVLPNAEVAAHLEREAQRRNGQVTMTIPVPLTAYFLEYLGHRYTVNELIVRVNYVSARGPVKWSTYSMSGDGRTDNTVDQMEARFGGQRMRFLFPNGPSSERVVLKIDSVPDAKCGDSSDSEPSTLPLRTRPPSSCPLHTPPAHPTSQRKMKPPRKSAAQSFARKSKVGRNDPCPCNSGKKFKHCCLNRQHGAN